MEDFLGKFGHKVKEFRKLSGLSQEKFAELIEVSPTTVTAIETGRNFVTYATLKNICEVLNIEPKQLFDFEITDGLVENSSLHKIIVHSKQLTPEQQKQVIEILKTFK